MRFLHKLNVVGGRIASVLLLLSVFVGWYFLRASWRRAEIYDQLQKGESYEVVVAKLGKPTSKRGVKLDEVYWRSLKYRSPSPAILECRWKRLSTISVWFDAEGRVVGKHLW